MTLLWAEGAQITVRLDSAHRLTHFVWQGRVHRVAQIVEQWQIDMDWWTPHGPIHRAYAAIITADGLFCVLYCDLTCDEWRLVRLYD